MQYVLPTLVSLAIVASGFMFVRSMLSAASALQSGRRRESGDDGPDLSAAALGMTDWGAAAPVCLDSNDASCAVDGGGGGGGDSGG